MIGIVNKKTINLKNLLFLSILFIFTILNFSFIRVSANGKNTVNDSQDNLVKEQLRQLAKEALDMQTISIQKQQELNEALTKSRKILEECENTDVESDSRSYKTIFDNINKNLNNKIHEKYYRIGNIIGQDMNTKYNFKLEQIEKCEQIFYKILEGKTEDITTLTNEEAECVKIVIETIIKKVKISEPFFNNYIIAINNLKKRIKYAKTATNPKTEITKAIAEYKKTLEEKFKELKKNIKKQTIKTDEPFYKKIWFWITLTTLTILIIASCGFFIYKKNKTSK